MTAFWTLYERSVRGLIEARDRNSAASWDSNFVK